MTLMFNENVFFFFFPFWCVLLPAFYLLLFASKFNKMCHCPGAPSLFHAAYSSVPKGSVILFLLKILKVLKHISEPHCSTGWFDNCIRTLNTSPCSSRNVTLTVSQREIATWTSAAGFPESSFVGGQSAHQQTTLSLCAAGTWHGYSQRMWI